MRELAGMYYQGNGTSKDYEAALLWYRQAADLGSVDAEDEIAILFPPPEAVIKAEEQGPVPGDSIKRVEVAAAEGPKTQPQPEAKTQGEGTEVAIVKPVFRMEEQPEPASVEEVEVSRFEVTEPAEPEPLVPSVPETTAARSVLISATAPAPAEPPAEPLARNASQVDDSVAELFNAAREGDADAQVTLGRRYEVGDQIARDPARAALWYGRAAQQGNAFAQSSLGYLYVKGDGVPRDKVQAHKWFTLAADQNYATAADARDAIARDMKPADVESSRRLAEGWAQRHGLATGQNNSHGLGTIVETSPPEPAPVSTLQEESPQANLSITPPARPDGNKALAATSDTLVKTR